MFVWYRLEKHHPITYLEDQWNAKNALAILVWWTEFRLFTVSECSVSRRWIRCKSKYVHKFSQSVSQDRVNSVCGDAIIPAKDILLTCGVRSLTINVEFIQVLNHLGNNISYSKLIVLYTMDTALEAKNQCWEGCYPAIN